MAGEQNVEVAKRGYAAFTAGDATAAMEILADDIEWISPGDSAVSGTIHGKQAVAGQWGQLAGKGFTTTPQFWFSDAERVVVLTHITLEGGAADTCDVLTFRAGKVVKFQTAGDTALLERVFGSK
jgi:ketosteroid isomerase-like protein